MRTSGPCLPSGRSPGSISSGGSGAGRASSACRSSATACAAWLASCSSAPGYRVVHEHHVGVAAVAGLVPAEAAHRHDAQPGRAAGPARPRPS